MLPAYRDSGQNRAPKPTLVGSEQCGCTGYETCGGGGTPGFCGCTPLTACPSDYQCGSIPDGCGGTVDCSGGRSCEAIVGKKFWVCVAEAHQCCKHARCTDEDAQ